MVLMLWVEWFGCCLPIFPFALSRVCLLLCDLCFVWSDLWEPELVWWLPLQPIWGNALHFFSLLYPICETMGLMMLVGFYFNPHLPVLLFLTLRIAVMNLMVSLWLVTLCYLWFSVLCCPILWAAIVGLVCLICYALFSCSLFDVCPLHWHRLWLNGAPIDGLPDCNP